LFAGTSWELCWDYGHNFEFLGKRPGFVGKASPIAKERCAEFIERFEATKRESEIIIYQARDRRT
jgi:hypothetical protein